MLLEMKGLRIDGWSEDQETWLPIVKGVDVHLKRGEVLGLIGESGAGKSTIGLAALRRRLIRAVAIKLAWTIQLQAIATSDG
jgi:ABC-type glutathione transport system ATPase component